MREYTTRITSFAIGILVFLLASPLSAREWPNVLLVTIDTLRADRVGCYGYRNAETPTLDRLAREGVRFEKAFSPIPLTLPAHASILTGTYPPYHGVRDNSGFVLRPQHTSLAVLVKQLGYSTGAFVGAYVLDSKFGLNRGFDHYYDNFDLAKYENVSPGYIRRPGSRVVREALKWLQAGGGKSPFFAWVHLYDPHDPYEPPEPWAARHSGRPYDGAIAFADANVGALLAWLKKSGAYERTLIIVIGDHGEALGDHGEETHGFFIYNASLHIPLLIRFPDGLYAGKTIAQNVSAIDVFPTVAEILDIHGANLPAIQGQSLMPLIQGRSLGERLIYAESYYPRFQFGWSELRALIRGSEKYVLAPRPELYDLKQNFHEAHNLAAQQQAASARMRDTLEALFKSVSGAGATDQASTPVGSGTTEKLRSLGYVAHSMGSSGTKNFQSLADPKDQIGTYKELLLLAERNSRGDYRSTIPRYQALVRTQPGLKLAHYKLGQAYSRIAEFLAAAEEYKAAIALGGDVLAPTFELAMCYMQLGRPDDAIAGFRRVVEMDPSHYQARTNLGVLLTSPSRIPEAIAQLQKAVALAPTSSPALSSLGIAYSMAGEHEKGVETLKKALKLSPRDALLHANLGAIYKRMGRTAEAEKQFAIARHLKPGYFQN